MNEKYIEIFITPDNQLQFIHDDSLAVLLESMGVRRDQRASHVEPDPDRPGMWMVDLSPIAGKLLMLGPFKLRREALDAEVKWLSTYLENN